MVGSITEKDVIALGITAIFGAAAIHGYTHMQDIPSINNMADAALYGSLTTGLIVAVAGMAWAAGYLGGKIINTAFGTQKMDDILGRVAGYGAALTTALVLASDMTAHATESPAQPLNSVPHSAAEIMLPPPVAFEEGSDTRTYSLKDMDTVQQLDVKEGGANIVNYNFSNEKARYYELHVHGKDIELTPIAIKPFWDIAAEELAHARVMGCKAALETGLGDNNPYKEMSTHYLKTYCPHP